MDRFKCYLCSSDFHSENETIQHLKEQHEVKEKTHPLKCIVKNTACTQTYQTWSGFKKHIKTCIKKVAENSSCCQNNEKPIPIENYSNNLANHKIQICFDHNNTERTDDIQYDEIEKGEKEEAYFYSRMIKQSESFAHQVDLLPVAQNVKNRVFELAKNMLIVMNEFQRASINEFVDSSDDNILEVLDVAHNAFLDEIRKYDDVYKRNKICVGNELYVQPIEKTIGTHWETKRNIKTQKKIPLHTQSVLQYVPITETLKSLFRQKNVKKLYCDYNAISGGSKHNCIPGNYKDFCCGEVYRENALFKNHPDSLQIQIFTDGFEMCDPLKSKTNLHSQVVFYFTIRNLPQELAFMSSSIHLVVLCNANDLKTPQTDYNNIWKLIVDDISSLETTGIDIGEGVNLKGIYIL